MKCPTCGTSVSIARLARVAARKVANGFASEVPSVIPAPYTAPVPKTIDRQPVSSTSEPARSASWESDFIVPLAQSVVTGLPLGIATAAIWSIQAGVTVAALSWFSTWLWLLRDHNAQLWKIEEIFNADLDGDGQIGKPQIEQEPDLPLAWIKNTKKEQWLGEQPKVGGSYKPFLAPFRSWKEANLIAYALLIRRIPFTRSRLVEAGAFPNDPAHYTKVYNAMKDSGLIVEGNLTKEGKEYMALFLPPHWEKYVEKSQ